MAIAAILIGVLVLALASAVYAYAPGMVDDGDEIFWIVGGFLVIYVTSAVLVTTSLSPFSV